MSIENKKLINLLAQAIQDINTHGSDVLEIIDRLNCDMRDVADTSEPILPRRKYDEVWKVPELVPMECFYDRNEFERTVPRGYRLRVAFLTNKSWCETYNIATQEPHYVEAPAGSGAEYVDVFFERTNRNCDIAKASAFHRALKDAYMLKTMNSFGIGSSAPCEHLRFTVTHDKFREDQMMDQDSV